MAFSSPSSGSSSGLVLPHCKDSDLRRRTRVEVHEHALDGMRVYVYVIRAGQTVLRGDPLWVKSGQANDQDIVSLVSDPHDFGQRSVVYFSYEDGKSYNEEGTRHARDVLGDEYGHVVLFDVTKDLHLLAIDYPESRAWLAHEMRKQGLDGLVHVLQKRFTPTAAGKRKSEADDDAQVADFVCGVQRGGRFVFDGYGASRQFYPNFHAELALCMRHLNPLSSKRSVPVNASCVAKVDNTKWLAKFGQQERDIRKKRQHNLGSVIAGAGAGAHAGGAGAGAGASGGGASGGIIGQPRQLFALGSASTSASADVDASDDEDIPSPPRVRSRLGKVRTSRTLNF